MYDTSTEGLAQVKTTVEHPDNHYRLGQLTIWHSKPEGVGIEIDFGRVSAALPGEHTMAVSTLADLITLHRELGEMIRDLTGGDKQE
jgi:hypothetical protein